MAGFMLSRSLVGTVTANLLPLEAVFNSNAESGQPVYVVNGTNVDLADNVTNFRVIGLTFESVLSGNTGRYITEGTVEKSNWTNVVGSIFLIPGVVYYLNSVSGELTFTPPSAGGRYLVAVARAASNTKLNIEIAEPILL